MPVVPSNMSSVINEDLAHQLSEDGYFYIMHRFGDNYNFIRRAFREQWKTVSVSIGVKRADYDFIEWLSHGFVNIRNLFITIDIAHGHSSLVKDMISHIKIHLPTAKIIAGNVATPEGTYDLWRWGADAVKIGIAGGAACSTKTQTGFHVPMFSCVKNCTMYNSVLPIIADGGVRDNGDIAKALMAGANMVMAGSLFSACTDSPADDVTIYKLEGYEEDGKKILEPERFKVYYGSASARQKGERKYVEGFQTKIKCNGLTYREKLDEIREILQSACSYAGGKNLESLKYVSLIRTK